MPTLISKGTYTEMIVFFRGTSILLYMVSCAAYILLKNVKGISSWPAFIVLLLPLFCLRQGLMYPRSAGLNSLYTENDLDFRSLFNQLSTRITDVCHSTTSAMLGIEPRTSMYVRQALYQASLLISHVPLMLAVLADMR